MRLNELAGELGTSTGRLVDAGRSVGLDELRPDSELDADQVARLRAAVTEQATRATPSGRASDRRAVGGSTASTVSGVYAESSAPSRYERLAPQGRPELDDEVRRAWRYVLIAALLVLGDLILWGLLVGLDLRTPVLVLFPVALLAVAALLRAAVLGWQAWGPIQHSGGRLKGQGSIIAVTMLAAVGVVGIVAIFVPAASDPQKQYFGPETTTTRRTEATDTTAATGPTTTTVPPVVRNLTIGTCYLPGIRPATASLAAPEIACGNAGAARLFWAEARHYGDAAGAPYPDGLADRAAGECAMYAAQEQPGAGAITALAPTPAQWTDGERWLACFVEDS